MVTRPSRRARGVTLLETLAVLAILGVLATVAIFTFQNAVATARAKTAQMNLHTIATALIVESAQNPNSGLTRDMVTDALAEATGSPVVDGVAADVAVLGFADQWPGEGEYSAAFDGTDPDDRGDTAALMATGGGRTFAQIVSVTGDGLAGPVPNGTSPSQVLTNPAMLLP